MLWGYGDLPGDTKVIETEQSLELKPGDSYRHYHIRKRMIRDQIVARGVKDPKVIAALETVPRHRFVSEALEGAAYDDNPLPIGENQTISQPFIVAYMTTALQLSGNERILEIGTGSGYQAAVLSEIVSEVYTVEINDNLIIEVALRLKKMGCQNVHLHYGDGYEGWPEFAPFDGIIVTAAPDHIPPSLLDHLKIGGRMIIPVGDKEQELLLVTRREDGSFKQESRIPVRFVPMIREVEKDE